MAPLPYKVLMVEDLLASLIKPDMDARMIWPTKWTCAKRSWTLDLIKKFFYEVGDLSGSCSRLQPAKAPLQVAKNSPTLIMKRIREL